MQKPKRPHAVDRMLADARGHAEYVVWNQVRRAMAVMEKTGCSKEVAWASLKAEVAIQLDHAIAARPVTTTEPLIRSADDLQAWREAQCETETRDAGDR